jgi:hypothetical protein
MKTFSMTTISVRMDTIGGVPIPEQRKSPNNPPKEASIRARRRIG